MSEIGERSAMNDDFRYSIDLSVARARAEKIIECIKRLRENHDIRRFEYTKHLRVAPTETPHSHPILTLNTQLHNPDENFMRVFARADALVRRQVRMRG